MILSLGIRSGFIQREFQKRRQVGQFRSRSTRIPCQNPYRMQNSSASSTFKQEWVGGVTTFLTMSYILIVNPAILSTPGTGLTFSGVMTGTVVLSFLMTLFMGLYAKLPFGVAPGMGINAFFTFSLILGHKIPWQIALGMVFWAGVLFVLTSITPVRAALVRAIPDQLRKAAATGIG
ncbi:MAG: NCS2 family permease, partial [Proteobacteria bacterium]